MYVVFENTTPSDISGWIDSVNNAMGFPRSGADSYTEVIAHPSDESLKACPISEDLPSQFTAGHTVASFSQMKSLGFFPGVQR